MSELAWRCSPQKGGDCPNPRLPFKPFPGARMPWLPWRRKGLHVYSPGQAHESYFDMVRR